MFAVLFAFVACGGSSNSGPTEAPMTMTAAGLSSNAITIPSGGRVHFFNKDTVAHQISSPDCGTDLDTAMIAPGGDSLQPLMTGPLSCTFQDAITSSAIFDGSVTVNAPGTPGQGSGY
jgi:hypothetical protein